MEIRKRSEQKVIKLVEVGVLFLWGHFGDGILKACDKLCWKKRVGRSKEDTWRWSEEVKEAASRTKDAH